jgi:predicted DNA-binding transcriptional regulator YafY
VPATSTRRTLSRQWELLKLLPNHAPGLTSAELQSRLSDAGYKTSKRTVERDLVELSCIFPVQCNDKGTPYGWYWTPGSSANLPGIALGEALTLCLVEDSIRPLIPSFMLKSLAPRFNQARQKLQALSEENASARWFDKVASVQPELTLLPPEINLEFLQNLQDALLNDTQIACRYYSAHQDKTRNLTLNPLAMVQRGHITYLIATAEPFDDPRQYAIHRFEEARVLTSPSLKPEGFDLKQYIANGSMQFASKGEIHLRAWISDDLARLISETPISADMQLIKQQDGSTLTATVNDSWELKWWILSHVGSLVVHAPETLREEITSRIKNGLEKQTVHSISHKSTYSENPSEIQKQPLDTP